MTTYYVGLDLGKSKDYTALAVVQAKLVSEELHLQLRYLERHPLHTNYTAIADHVKRLLSRLGRDVTELIVDKRGVGEGVTDILKERGVPYTAVIITGSQRKVKYHPPNEYSVPKRDLAAALEVPFNNGTLKVASGLTGWGALREELLLFRRKQNKRTAHVSYEHWRASDHDDLVLAAALACWKATYKPAKPRKALAKLG